jgi:hypothetical protein
LVPSGEFSGSVELGVPDSSFVPFSCFFSLGLGFRQDAAVADALSSKPLV